MLIYILENFLLHKLNAKQIETSLESKFKLIPSYQIILNTLHNIRCVISNYMKDKYIRIHIGGSLENNKIVTIDECLMTHDNGI